MAVKNVPKEARIGNPVTNDTAAGAPVGELVRSRSASLSPAERKLARVLLASYPIAGLESVARFAGRAGVSPPTVTRFIGKLGFRGYPQFQEVLRGEVQERLSSPLVRYRDERRRRRSDSVLADALEVARANLQETLELLSQRDFEEVVDLLSDPRRRVLVIGGGGSGQQTGAPPPRRSSTSAAATCCWSSTIAATRPTRSRSPGSPPPRAARSSSSPIPGSRRRRSGPARSS